MINSATELFLKLKEQGYDNQSRDPWWWPQSGTFKVVIGAILTQNTTWLNVEKTFKNLEEHHLIELEALASVDNTLLEKLLRPSGFYRAKSKNTLQLSLNILQEYGTFKNFQNSVTRAWLLAQRGIGEESADAILNYACYQEAFVVDNYTNRLLQAFGYEFTTYQELQEWIVEDFFSSYNAVFPELPRAQAYARTHGMVVEYCKINKSGRKIKIDMLL